MAPVHKYSKLYLRGSSKSAHGVQSRARSASGVDNIIHQDDYLVLDREIDLCFVDVGNNVFLGEVIAVKGYVQLPYGDVRTLYFPDVPCKQDSQTILRLLKAGYEVDVVPEELSLYYNVSHVISGAKERNIRGEEMYRTECRKLYYLLEDWQIMKVEYKFAEKFYRYFFHNKWKDKMKYELDIMKKLDPKAARIFILKEIYHKIKK